MKKFTLRRTVLASIGLFASVMLLIGLGFDILAVDLSELGNIGGGMIYVKMDMNGFKMLSFSLPKLLRTACLTFIKEDDCILFETLFGISSWLTLLVSIVAAVCVVFAFFGEPKKKNEDVFLAVIVVGVICALLQTVLSVIWTSTLQTKMNEYYEKLGTGEEYMELIKFTTTAFVSLIIQAVCLIAYVLCSNNIKNGTGEGRSANVQIASNKVSIVKTVGMEIEVAKLLTAYKDLCDAQIISVADYTNKKVYLLRYAEKKIKSGINELRGNCSLETVVQIEEAIVSALKEYTQLLHTGIISDADFFEIKATLLACMVKE